MFEGPKNSPETELQREREDKINDFAKELKDYVARNLAGKTLESIGVKVLGKENDPHWHYSNQNSIWTTPVGSEAGSIMSIGKLAQTKEGQRLIEQFISEKSIDDQYIIEKVKDRIKNFN